MNLSKYVVNFEEFIEEFKLIIEDLIDDEFKRKYPQINTSNVEFIIENIKDKLPDALYKNLKNKMSKIAHGKPKGTQRVKSVILDTPPLIQDNILEFVFEKDVYMTGIHINQTGWKKEDKYSLEAHKTKILNNVSTKEIGEHKYFNTYFKVKANVPISFILHNFSGNSRQLLIDLEYLETNDITEVVDPNVPTIDDIPNEWDIAVVMQWEENVNADIDIYGRMGSTLVFFGNKEDDGLYLNFDYLEHMTNSNPEILSVKGNKNKKLDVILSNYHASELKEKVNIKIYNKKNNEKKLLKEYDVDMNKKVEKVGVCSIDLNTYVIKDLIGGM